MTAVFQPELDDLCNTCLEKLHVILDEMILEMFVGKGTVISDDFVIVTIAYSES